MTEPERLSGLFSDLYNGQPWIEVTLLSTLENISAEQAQKRAWTNCNTIWEIVRHLIRWRQNVLQRVQGQVIKTPGNNYIEPVQDTSEAAWAALLKELEETQTRWLEFLAIENGTTGKRISGERNDVLRTYSRHYTARCLSFRPDRPAGKAIRA